MIVSWKIGEMPKKSGTQDVIEAGTSRREMSNNDLVENYYVEEVNDVGNRSGLDGVAENNERKYIDY